MSNCNPRIRQMEIRKNLKKDTNDELIDATLYNLIIDSVRYLCNT